MPGTMPDYNMMMSAFQEALRSCPGSAETDKRLDEIYELVRSTSQKLDGVAVLVDAHEKAIRGNGTPGLLAVMNEIRPQVQESNEILKGKGDKPGMVARIDAIEKRLDGYVKPAWTVVSTALAMLTTYLLTTFLPK